MCDEAAWAQASARPARAAIDAGLDVAQPAMTHRPPCGRHRTVRVGVGRLTLRAIDAPAKERPT